MQLTDDVRVLGFPCAFPRAFVRLFSFFNNRRHPRRPAAAVRARVAAGAMRPRTGGHSPPPPVRDAAGSKQNHRYVVGSLERPRVSRPTVDRPPAEYALQGRRLD
jgi:hypothetical protein